MAGSPRASCRSGADGRKEAGPRVRRRGVFCSLDWPELHRKSDLSAWSVPLIFFSFFYAAGVWVRLKAYEKGIFRGKSLPGFVVSVGNITTGGTGKTPAVATIARWAIGEGRKVAILSRGYGGKHKEQVLVVSDGEGIRTNALAAGDEPFLLARQVPGSCVVVSRDRFRAGILAHERFGSDFFILDDGFQHLPLKRDLNLALLAASDPFGNSHLLPWGPLREPLGQLKRADAFILTGCRTGGGGTAGQGGKAEPSMADRTVALLKGRFPLTPVFGADHLPERLSFPASGKTLDPGFLEGKRIVAFAGIARPERFRETLLQLGAHVLEFRAYADHHRFSRDELRDLARARERIGADYLVTTEKDWVRIAPLRVAGDDLGYLSVRFAFLEGQEGIFEILRDACASCSRGFMKG